MSAQFRERQRKCTCPCTLRASRACCTLALDLWQVSCEPSGICSPCAAWQGTCAWAHASLDSSPQQVAFTQRQGILQGTALDSITVQQQRSTHYKRCCSWWSCVAWRVTDSATYAFTCIEANWKSYAADLLGLCIIPCRAAHSQALAVAAARAFICNLVVYDHSAAHAPTSAPTCLPA